MEKTKVLCLILAIVLASAGTAGIVMGFGGETDAPIIPDNAVNTVMDKPAEGTPSDRSAIENLYIAQGELQRKGGFVGSSHGWSTSAGIKQEVFNNRVVSDGNVFKEMVTIGIVKNAYQLFLYNGNYLYRKFDSIKSADNIKWANSASKYAENDFLLKFGHRSDALTGYILNDDTIVSGVLEKEENGLFQYRYVLDIETAPARMLYEMKTNSNMSDYSTFVKAEIIVVMDSDWQVKTVTTDCKYKVPMFGGLDCVEDITETFSDLNGQELPEKDFFEQFFDAEVENPVDKDPDALNILMDMFAPYIGNGNKLNASLSAAIDGKEVVNGLVSAKIDIENIQNIEVAAKIGEDLFIEYQQGNLYVSYQDFKASTTVDGIMGVVNALTPKAGDAQNGEIDTDDILSKITYSVNDGVCTVNLPLELGGECLEANIYANVTEDGYQFTNANVTVGSLELKIELANGFDVPEHSGQYPEILGLLDLVKNGVIYGNVSALGMEADVTFDLSTMSLYAKSGDLSIIYQNGAIFAQYGAIKAKLNVSDVERIVSMLRIAGIIDGDLSFELPQISVEQVVGMLAQIQAVATDNGVKFVLDFDGISAGIYLVESEAGWNVDKVTVSFDGNDITLALTEPTSTEIPEVDGSQYADAMEVLDTFINPVVSLMSASSYGADFDFDILCNGLTYNVVGSFAYDVNGSIKVNAEFSNGVATLIKANVTVADNAVYMDVNGLKAAFSVEDINAGNADLSQITESIYGVNDGIDGVIDTLTGIVDKVKNINISSIDFENLITNFEFANGKLQLGVNAEFLGLGEIEVNLSVDEFNCLAAELNGITLGNVGLNAQASVFANVGKITIPNSDDYILNLKGSVQDVEFAVSADLLHMDIFASVNLFNQEILARYVNGKVYVAAGEIAVVGEISELGALIEYVTSALEMDVNIGLGEVSDLNLSLETILNGLVLDLDGSSLGLAFKLGDAANLSVIFDNNANFAGITAEIMGYNLNVENGNDKVNQLDLDRVYIPVESLAKQIIEIYTNYKNVLNTGIAVNVDGNVSINETDYALNATINYNGGLYLNAVISDSVNALAVLDMYLVDNVIYLDVNGVRIAANLPQNVQGGESVDLSTAMDLLDKAKGYNSVLDSVIDVIQQLPDKLNGVNYLDLLSSLTYENGTLFAGVNGEALGLSDFTLTLAGTEELTLTLSNLAIGDVTIGSLTVDAVPACGAVSAPVSDYVTELEVEVMGLTVTAKLDLLNMTAVAKTTLLGHELGLYYADNTAYVSYGAVKAKLNVADVNALLDIVSSFVDGGIPPMDMPQIDVKEVLNSVSKVSTENGYRLNLTVAGVTAALNFDVNARLVDINVNVNDMDVSAKLISGAVYPSFDLNSDYVDLLQLADTYAGEIRNIINAQGYDVTLNGSFAFGQNVYDVEANVIYNGGLYVNAALSYDSVKMLNAELWLVDGVLYVAAGDLKLAVAVPASSASVNVESDGIDLAPFKGYNPYLDSVLDVIGGIVDKFASGGVDYVSLIDGLTMSDGDLTLLVNGEQLSLGTFGVSLKANAGLYVNVSNLALDGLNAGFTAGIKASNEAITAPQGDFTTNLSVKIDDKNTIYANLDLINGVYNFRLDDMYIMYADNIVKLNKGDIYISGNINQIVDYVKQIDDLVNEFSGATDSALGNVNIDLFKNVDLKAIVNSLTIQAVQDSVMLGIKAFGMDVQAEFTDGKLLNVIVPVSLIDKTLEVEPCAAQVYDKFDGEHDYVQIEDVFQQYFPAFERLVHTNSWKFNFDGDAILSVGTTIYKVASGSYLEFYYKNTEGMDTFKLRAKLDVYKQKSDGSWQPYMNIDAAYKDGSIYVTDRGRLIDGKKESDRSVIRLTVSVDTLVKCFGLYDEIVAVVPQIGELVDSMMAAMKEAESNAENISYATILNDVSYVDGLFGLDLNGASLLSKLGSIVLSAQTYGEGLSLNTLQFAYDNVSLQVNDLRVYASELDADYSDENKNDARWYGGMQYLAVQDILNGYNYGEYHMDFNSLYELLNSFVITAKPAPENNGARSFYISGTAYVSLSLGALPLANLPIGLAIKVDITKDNDVFISAKITRGNDKALGMSLYDDNGGDSYLNYDSTGNNGAGSFTVIRDSKKEISGTHKETVYEMYYYCTECQKENTQGEKECPTKVGGFLGIGAKPKHDASCVVPMYRYVEKDVANTALDADKCMFEDNISAEKFTANIIDYLFEMLNLNSSKKLLLGNNSIEGLIKDNISNSSSNNDFGIEDIFSNYSYSTASRDYNIRINLQPINSNLTSAVLDIYHNIDYSLDRIGGNVSLLNGLCTIDLNMALQNSVCGDTINIVSDNLRW